MANTRGVIRSKTRIILAGGGVFLAGILGVFFARSVEKLVEVSRVCDGTSGEDFVGCITHVALEREDAAYCWIGGMGHQGDQCRYGFARKVTNASLCKTLGWHGAGKVCVERFDEAGLAK